MDLNKRLRERKAYRKAKDRAIAHAKAAQRKKHGRLSDSAVEKRVAKLTKRYIKKGKK
jgi:hypothetical protein